MTENKCFLILYSIIIQSINYLVNIIGIIRKKSIIIFSTYYYVARSVALMKYAVPLFCHSCDYSILIHCDFFNFSHLCLLVRLPHDAFGILIRSSLLADCQQNSALIGLVYRMKRNFPIFPFCASFHRKVAFVLRHI